MKKQKYCNSKVRQNGMNLLLYMSETINLKYTGTCQVEGKQGRRMTGVSNSGEGPGRSFSHGGLAIFMQMMSLQTSTLGIASSFRRKWYETLSPLYRILQERYWVSLISI